MRSTFANCITNLAKNRSDIFLLSGDIGNRMFDDFKEIAPNRFINCGIAEGNMMSVAAGLALSKFRPFVYTITPFTTIRCLEQIKIGACYHNAPLVIVGTGSGLSYAELGPTHHSLEDTAILKALPNINIFTPSDSFELKNIIKETLDLDSPSYIRIGKKGEPNIYNNEKDFNFNKINWIKKGGDIAVLSYGPIINEALQAAEDLIKEKIEISVLSISKIRPFNFDLFDELLSAGINHLIILEEHYSSSGLFNFIQVQTLQRNLKFESIIPLGIPDEFINDLGKQNYLRKTYEIDKSSIIQHVKNIRK